MTPEATDYLGKARQCLASARAIFLSPEIREVVLKEAEVQYVAA